MSRHWGWLCVIGSCVVGQEAELASLHFWKWRWHFFLLLLTFKKLQCSWDWYDKNKTEKQEIVLFLRELVLLFKKTEKGTSRKWQEWGSILITEKRNHNNQPVVWCKPKPKIWMAGWLAKNRKTINLCGPTVQVDLASEQHKKRYNWSVTRWSQLALNVTPKAILVT